MGAWEDDSFFSSMGITKNQFIAAVKNRKDVIVPFVQKNRQAVQDATTAKQVIDLILEHVGSENLGGYAAIALIYGIPESHVKNVNDKFLMMVDGLNDEGALN